MAISKKTLKDTTGSQSYDAINDVFRLINSTGGDTIFVDETSDSFKVRYIGNTLVLKSDEGQVIKVNIKRPANGETVTNTLSFLDGDMDIVVTRVKGKIKAQLETTPNNSGTKTQIQKLSKKFVDTSLDLDDSGVGSIDHFTDGTVISGPGVTLTENTDTVSGNIFTSGLLYTPGGNDRINALQDEDVLTGTGTNPTLNLTLGSHNDNGTNVVTPQLINIETVNVDFTGSANTLDLRNADSISTLSVNRITAAAGDTGNFVNISQTAANLIVHDTSKAFVDVNFVYADNVLKGTTAGVNGITGTEAESGAITLKDVNLNSLYVGNGNGKEGFETLSLNSTGDNIVENFDAVDLENLTISGSGTLTLLDAEYENQKIKFNPGNGIGIGADGLGIRSIDASAYTGTLNIDITNAVGGHTDPINSGVEFYTDVKGGSGDDTFVTGNSITGDSAILRDNIDGMAGNNTLRAYASIVAKNYSDTATDDIASIKNIQTLEIRESGVTADIDAFDDTLAKVLMRDEHNDGPAVNITLLNIDPTLATSGNLVLRHPQDNEGDTHLHLYLKEASGANDTVKVTVENDFNTELQYNYLLDIDGNPNKTGVALTNQKVENVTIADNDTESNRVELTAVDASGKSEHTGTVLLTGGTAQKFFDVDSTLIAATVDGSSQLSDLRLTVGTANQTIKLGNGNDILTFANLDDFTASDNITDAGGTDTLRAAFSKDVVGTPTLAGIEKLHIVSTQTMSMDLANATGITELAILSDQAVNGDSDNSPTTREPFGIIGGIGTNDVITLNNTHLSTLNFFADNDTNDNSFSESPNHIFNGVNLASNSESALTVAINCSLDRAQGADSYSIGQLTSGATSLTITVGNEREIEEGATSSTTTTNIDNMLLETMTTMTVTAQGDIDLGTITGNGTKNNITSITTTAVLGDFTANVVGLGNNAVVNLGDGVNNFDALGSSGTNVTINSGKSNDIIGGTDQTDNINTGAGNDVIQGYKGNNVMSAGNGDDEMSAWEGSDTYSLGSGTLESVEDNFDTGQNGTGATNLVTLQGSAALVRIDHDGDGFVEINQMLAGGNGTTLTVRWDGISNSIIYSGSSLNGGTSIKASAIANATYFGDANANFVIADDNANAITFSGGDGADVFMVEANGTGAFTARTFNGGSGNDAFVGSDVGDDVTGGTGADRLVLSTHGDIDNFTDIVHFSVGDSTASGFDQVYGFGTSVFAGLDQLDLATTTIAGPTFGFIDGVDAGTGETGVGFHSIDGNGFVRFIDTLGHLDTVGTGTDQISLTNALQYLSTALDNSGSTVLFQYDREGDGITDDSFVYQDGVQDTIVQLVGVTANFLSEIPGNDVVQIV